MGTPLSEILTDHPITAAQAVASGMTNLSIPVLDLSEALPANQNKMMKLSELREFGFSTIITTQFYSTTAYNGAARWVSPFNQTTAYASYAALLAASPIFRVPCDGVLKHFWITARANTWSAGTSCVYTVLVNGAETALTVTLNSGILAVYDNANSVSVVEGDIIAFLRNLPTGGTSGSAGPETFNVMFQGG